MTDESISLITGLWLPFLATVGASFTVLFFQSLNQYRKEHRQRLYAVAYMADVLSRLVHSELILQKHTIGPHIEATKRILSGDRRLLEITLDTDEFDILAAGPMNFINLSDDHKLLVGYDNIKIVQAFDALLYLHTDDTNRLAIRSFVAGNLKSKRQFLGLSDAHQTDVLNTYWDYLRSLEHEGKRLVAFAFHIFIPMLRTYLGAKKFLVFKTKPISSALEEIEDLRDKYPDIVPPPNYFEQTRGGGIQSEL